MSAALLSSYLQALGFSIIGFKPQLSLQKIHYGQFIFFAQTFYVIGLILPVA